MGPCKLEQRNRSSRRLEANSNCTVPWWDWGGGRWMIRMWLQQRVKPTFKRPSCWAPHVIPSIFISAIIALNQIAAISAMSSSGSSSSSSNSPSGGAAAGANSGESVSQSMGNPCWDRLGVNS